MLATVAVLVFAVEVAVEAIDEVWPPFCANRVDDDDEEDSVDGDRDEVDVELIELLLLFAAGVGEGWAAGAGYIAAVVATIGGDGGALVVDWVF